MNTTTESKDTQAETACCDTTCCTPEAPKTTAEEEKALKKNVQDFYSKIALSSNASDSSDGSDESCGNTGCCGIELDIKFAEDYSHLEGYVADADLGLGCGLPTEYANIQEGESVLDLGSGAGNDAFVARRLVGESGSVQGVDFTGEMVKKARDNARKLGYENVSFHLGDIESLPIAASSIDLVVSNCVLNLVPNKRAVFAQIFKALKPGGRFCISDIVLDGDLPAKLREVVSLYAGCVTGAVSKSNYLQFAKEAGFVELSECRLSPLHVPNEALGRHLTEAEQAAFLPQTFQLFSLTLVGYKPANT